jgi:hypothetical protein
MAPPAPRSIIEGMHARTVCVPDALEVHGDHRVPRRFEGALVEVDVHRRDTGIGQHDVEVPERVATRGDGVLQLPVLAHVGPDRDDAPPEVAHELLGLGQVGVARHGVGDGRQVGAEVDGDDVGALFRQPDGVRATLPATRPRDERDLAVEQSHAGSRLCVRCARDPGPATGPTASAASRRFPCTSGSPSTSATRSASRGAS